MVNKNITIYGSIIEEYENVATFKINNTQFVLALGGTFDTRLCPSVVNTGLLIF